ncbi:reductase [Lithospermum erythrorhizon]|uniref:Reductase n=1 Tax=Lithospermum erythrorhizon TaxID=34254 RepID=A0AAV3RXV7_LITER
MALQMQQFPPLNLFNNFPTSISSIKLKTPFMVSAISASSIPKQSMLNFNFTGRFHKLRSVVYAPLRCFSALSPELKTTLDKVVTSQKVILFMKGTKDFPQCGFSNTVVQILTTLNVPFETINILENEMLRQGLKEYSSWPTFPQLYIDGEFFGGCDIVVEAYKSGELQELVEKALCS